MCCKLPFIKELEKPPGRWCRHAVIGKGCGIYEDRPQVCRSFNCQWILDASLGPEWKPEKAKFILYRDREREEVFNVAVDAAFPDAWTKPPFFATIKNWVLAGAQLGRFVMVRIGTRWVAVLPDRLVELGNIEGDFVVERERDRTGKTTEVRIMPSSASKLIPSAVHPESESGVRG